jgi:hypothetical protein
MALLDYCYVQAQLFILLHNKTAFFLADFAHCLLQNSPDDEILHIGAVAVAMKLKSGDVERCSVYMRRRFTCCVFISFVQITLTFVGSQS